jgi:hypothetical protein
VATIVENKEDFDALSMSRHILRPKKGTSKNEGKNSWGV